MSEEGYLDVFEPNLFLNESYTLRDFTFGDVNLQINCSPSASTDYDLTGQVLWPGASVLSSYLASNTPMLLQHICACELGAGLGLVGLLCGQYCHTVLTDHNEVVLRVLEQNAKLNKRGPELRCAVLEWKSDTDISSVLALSPEGKGYDLLLGADVCYDANAVPALLAAASRLLLRTADSVFYLGYVSRWTMIDAQVLTESKACGFVLEEVPGTRQTVAGGMDAWVYKLRWNATTLSDRQ